MYKSGYLSSKRKKKKRKNVHATFYGDNTFMSVIVMQTMQLKQKLFFLAKFRKY